MTVQETPRLLLRHLVPDDMGDLAALYADPEVMRFWPRPYSREETRAELERLQAYYTEHGFGLWATIHKPDGRFIGRCGLLRKTLEGAPELEVAYMIGHAYWGRGLATEAARAIAGHAFRELGPPRLVSYILPENLGSRSVAKKNGMQPVGETLHAGLLHLVYAVERDEWLRRCGAV